MNLEQGHWLSFHEQRWLPDNLVQISIVKPNVEDGRVRDSYYRSYYDTPRSDEGFVVERLTGRQGTMGREAGWRAWKGRMARGRRVE